MGVRGAQGAPAGWEEDLGVVWGRVAAGGGWAAVVEGVGKVAAGWAEAAGAEVKAGLGQSSR